MRKLIALLLLVAGSPVVAMARVIPEIDPASGASALALIAGGLLILRSCRKK
jgi:hypothetical protein